jgi:hypothetical protein
VSCSRSLSQWDSESVISPSVFDKVDADDYTMHEKREKSSFRIKPKTDEYCFTNVGGFYVDGTSDVSEKSTLRRFNFSTNRVVNVALETTGTVNAGSSL